MEVWKRKREIGRDRWCFEKEGCGERYTGRASWKGGRIRDTELGERNIHIKLWRKEAVRGRLRFVKGEWRNERRKARLKL